MKNCKAEGMLGDQCQNLPICLRMAQLESLEKIPEVKTQLQGITNIISAIENNRVTGCLCTQEILNKAIQIRRSLQNPQ